MYHKIIYMNTYIDEIVEKYLKCVQKANIHQSYSKKVKFLLKTLKPKREVIKSKY